MSGPERYSGNSGAGFGCCQGGLFAIRDTIIPPVAKAKTKGPKLNPSTLKAAVGALAIEDELARLGALRDGLDPSEVGVAQALLEMPECSERGVASAWLRSLVGAELTDQDAHAIGELATVATAQRQILATLGQQVADRISPAVLARAARHGIEMPICATVDAILHRGAGLDEAIRGLLARPLRREGA